MHFKNVNIQEVHFTIFIGLFLVTMPLNKVKAVLSFVLIQALFDFRM